MSDSKVRQLEKRLESLEEQYGELAQIAGGLAHEIKNPLSVIRMNMELVAEDLEEEPSDDARRALTKVNTIHDQCIRLEKLLNDFLKFARLRNLELLSGDLNEQLETVLNLFAMQAQESGIEIVSFLDPKLPSIKMDVETLQAALVNLVKNAIEAMPDGGQLTAITRVTRDGVALDLIDTGCGMNETTAMNMFKTFYTTKIEGSGLGLPMARKAIQAHGGRIAVQSEDGCGTKFMIEFPTPARIGK